MDAVKKFATREAPFLMSASTAVLTDETLTVEEPLGDDKQVQMQEKCGLVTAGPEGLTLYTADKLAKRSQALLHRSFFLGFLWHRSASGRPAHVELRSVSSGRAVKTKLTQRTLRDVRGLAQAAARGIFSGQYKAAPSKRTCTACDFRDTCPSSFTREHKTV